MVAVDEDGKPVEVPPLVPKNVEDKRRQQDAAERRAQRLKNK